VLLAIDAAAELVRPIFSAADSDLNVIFCMLCFYIINLPLIYQFQGFLEKIDFRWNKIKFTNSQIGHQIIGNILAFYGVYCIFYQENNSFIEEYELLGSKLPSFKLNFYYLDYLMGFAHVRYPARQQATEIFAALG
jgi:hypothetical protein